MDTNGDGTPPSEGARLNRPRRSRQALLGLVALGSLLLAGCQAPTFGAYRGATTQGQDEFKLWVGFFITGLIVGGIVFFLIMWAVIRYRRKGDAIPAQTQYHLPLEIIYTVLPIFIVIGLFVFTFITENEVDNISSHPSVDIRVTAFQWGWKFYYPGPKVLVEGEVHGNAQDSYQGPQMVVPAGETVSITLLSADVIHGFYVPQFNFSRYAQPGVSNHFNLTVIHSGTYRGQCTQLCGLYHTLMFFSVKAVPPAQFKAWEASHSSSNSEAYVS